MMVLIRHKKRKKLVLLAGVLMLSGFFIYELFPGNKLITLSYLIVLPFILLALESKKEACFIGLITTVFIAVGYLNSDFNGKAFLTNNRLLAGVNVWVIVCLGIYIKQTLRNEKTARNHLNAIFENSTEGIIVVNPKGEIIMINSQAIKIFGYQEQELKAKIIDQFILERFSNNHDLLRTRFHQFPHHRNKDKVLELGANRKDGTGFISEVSMANFFGNDGLMTIVFVNDITDRKNDLKKIRQLNEELEIRVLDRTKKLTDAFSNLEKMNSDLQREILAREKAEKRLIESHKLYKAMAKHFPSGIIGIVDKNLKHLLVTEEDSLEIKLQDKYLLDGKIFTLMNPVEKQKLNLELKKAFLGKTISLEIAVEENFYNLKAVPLPKENQIIDKALIVISDFTNIKKNELELKKNLEREKELGIIKTRFISTASHEFRTPLATILTSAYLLKTFSGEALNQLKLMHLNRISKSVNDLTDILDDFLSLSKLEEGKVKVEYVQIELDTFLKEIVKEMELQVKNHQVLDYKHKGEKYWLTDKKILRNIVVNLLSNAIKYSHPHSSIKFSSSILPGKLTLTFHDKGLGIPAKDLPLIFERFFRAENVSHIQGTGLGLNIVKKFIELMGGTINIKSKENIGSTFSVLLPDPTNSSTQHLN
ncbi:PAS domain-containing sensor histidine kinase [Arthrospiribacter ruber]|uniref:histidine kinase n=1 Tax=Arthrospiribacter ruber TaxID=2487934 RepID=A0A951MGN9_9BACT|nr:PAS domain-containing sensor histidine kinase [Arthrospiribacter ruber]MBW3469540.1 PAS domain-containing sensor histidine kinase [Arthrospiribacter ruber]